MVTIKDEALGEFQGETEKEALRALRKARRVEAKAEQARRADRGRAAENAYVRGFRLHEWLAEVRTGERESLPQAIRVRPPHESYSTSVREREFSRGHVATYGTPVGQLEFDHFGYHVEHVIDGGSGFVIGVILRDCDRGTRGVHAIGAHEGQIVLVHCTIDPDELIGAAKQ